MHKRKHILPRPIDKVKEWYGDIIGDALDPTSHSESGDTKHGHGHHHGHIALLFLFGALGLGCILQLFLDRWCKAIPYTCALFVAGCLISYIHWLNRHGHNWETWYNSVEMWQSINPHMLFFC